jgi:mRNA interferase MazF
VRPQPGEVWYADLSPVLGHEQDGVRPVLVMSRDDSGPFPVLLAIPTTTRYRGSPSHVPVVPPEGGLRAPSLLLCEQMRSLSLRRFERRLGRVSFSTMNRVFLVLHDLMRMRCPPPEGAPESRWIRV